jgi:hypothetical protein
LIDLLIYLFIYLVSTAAACVRHLAGNAIIVCLLIYYLVPAAAECVRHPAAA